MEKQKKRVAAATQLVASSAICCVSYVLGALTSRKKGRAKGGLKSALLRGPVEDPGPKSDPEG